MHNYSRILDVLRSVPQHPDVTPIEPQGHEALSFFPGQRGFIGASFPVGGLMLVANNYDNLAGWLEYEADPASEDESTSYKRLTDYIIAASTVPLDLCWLTNYCMGVMDKKNSQYSFPAKVRKALELERVFADYVAIMQPKVIVAMGGLAAECLKAPREPDHRIIGEHPTKLMAIDHPGRWHKGEEYFRAEGERIRRAWEAA